MHLTNEDRKKIEQLLRENQPVLEICRRLNRHRNVLYREINKNGGRFKYDAVAAARKAVEIERGTKSRAMKNLSKAPSLENRIQHLEMQVKILTDVIKQMRKNDQEND